MKTKAIENYAKKARNDFRKLVTDKAHALGIGKKEIAKAVEKGDALVIHGQAFPVSIKRQRDELIAIVHQQGFDHVVDAMAYTLFNRLCALRFMEVHDYLPQRVLSAKDGGDVPDILRNATDVADKLFSDPKARKEIKELKLAGTQDQELYRRLILAQCNALASAMPFLFERQQDCSELLMPDNLLHSDSVVRDMVKSIDESDWQEIEIIGWLYQYYISERKDEVIGSVVEKEDIPAATQLFTPKWIVRYMVENSLGRLWLESHPNSPLKTKMPYFIENPDDGKAPPAKRHDTPDEIKCMDDACGSGHILVYKFDLLYEMYAECGYPKTEIPALILKNNLYGLDIDERAAQLASFALSMKAREKDARFLEKGVFPNVIAIQESNSIDLDAMFNMGVRDTTGRSPFDDPNRLFADQGLLPTQRNTIKDDEKGIQRIRVQFQPLVELFYDAKNYGSLLTIPKHVSDSLPDLKAHLASWSTSAQLFDKRAIQLLSDLVREALVLAVPYDICVTNPPWMGSKSFNSQLKQFCEKNYPAGKADLYSCFMLRNQALVGPDSRVAMITIPNWMFLGSFEKLREGLLESGCIESMVHVGRGAWGSDFGSCAFVLKLSSGSQSAGGFRRLFRRQGEVNTNDELVRRFFDKDGWPTFHATSADFKQIPGCPIAYWATRKTLQAFASVNPLAKAAEPRKGLDTGNNALFLRYWHEVDFNRLALACKDRQEAKESGSKWFPCQKGGDFRRWYGNHSFVVNWKDDGEAIRGYFKKPAIRNERYYFKEGGTWSTLTISRISMRLCPRGFLFESKGSVCFPKDLTELHYLIAYVNSCVAESFLLALAPTVDFHEGPLGRLPYKKAPTAKVIEANTLEAVHLSRQDWDNFENSWDFNDVPLLRNNIKGKTLEESWHAYSAYCTESIRRLQGIETENNLLFLEAYGLQDELKPEVPEDQITLARADAEKDIRAFISYAIGCMMGRYSLSKPGLQFAGGEWDETVFKGAKFKPDHDGILPVLNDAYFEDDPTERLAEFLTVTFGKETLNENLQFVAQTLGMKGNESPRDTIRRYLAEGFFRDHLRTYKKRPIYWLFSSGKERAFQALVYMHRYTPATLSRMRTAYLHELQNKLNARVDEVQRGIEDATSTAQSNRLNKELIRLRRQQAELLAFDEKLNNIAGKKVAIDLDDGVKHNYGLFDDLLAEVKTVCGKDEE
jgi:hypothetical protein